MTKPHNGKISHKNNRRWNNSGAFIKRKPENATPWRQFKDDLSNDTNFTERRNNPEAELDPINNIEEAEENGHSSSKLNPTEREFQKSKEENYKKFVMEQKRKEPVTWEDFNSEKEGSTSKPTHSIMERNKFQNKNNPFKSYYTDKSKHISSLPSNTKHFMRRCLTKFAINNKVTSLDAAVERLKLQKEKAAKKKQHK